jgi:hypothetical protein
MFYIVCLYIVFFWDHHRHSAQSTSIYGNFNKFGNVKVYLDQPSGQVGWPDAIKLINSINKKAEEERSTKTSTTYKTMIKEPSIFAWQPKDVVITLKIPLQTSLTSTRLVPPVSWLQMSGSTVTVVNDGVMEEDKSDAFQVIEIITDREKAERTLSILKFNGFNRETIFRVLDKGPWLLAFGISKSLPRLYEDMGSSLGLNQSQITHVLSHCPYLIAQYDRYKGRDVVATITALYLAGYTPDLLLKDVMRFPSMLAAPPDRILGWMNLLAHFGVGNKNGPSDFCSLLRRAPFMYYTDAPSITSMGMGSGTGLRGNDYMNAIGQSQPLGCSDDDQDPYRNDSSVATDALKVLTYMWELKLPDIDKIVRSQPDILLTNVDELRARVNCLYDIFHADTPTKRGKPSGATLSSANKQGRKNNNNDNNSNGNSNRNSIGSSGGDGYINTTTSNREMFSRGSIAGITSGRKPYYSQPQYTPSTHSSHSILMKISQSYPAALSVPSQKLRSLYKQLQTTGLRQHEIFKLVKDYPPLLLKSPQRVSEALDFLRYYCGFRTVDIAPFILKSPSLLEANVDDMKRNVAYLFKSLGATTDQLLHCPAYLTCDMHKHIIPRAEFLRTRGKDPLFQGLCFFVNSRPRDLATAAGVNLETFFPLSSKIKVESDR